MIAMVDNVWMNRVYGDTWNYFAPANATPVSKEQNLEVTTANLERWIQNPLAATRVGANEVLVLHRWSLVALVASPNPLWVGTGFRRVEPYIFFGRFRWRVCADRNTIGDVSVGPDGVVYNYAPPIPAFDVPNSFDGYAQLRTYGHKYGDLPLIIGPGAVVSIVMESIGNSGIGGDPPPEEPLNLNAEYSGYRIPYYPAQKSFSIT